jgi:hypothetical protein
LGDRRFSRRELLSEAAGSGGLALPALSWVRAATLPARAPTRTDSIVVRWNPVAVQ